MALEMLRALGEEDSQALCMCDHWNQHRGRRRADAPHAVVSIDGEFQRATRGKAPAQLGEVKVHNAGAATTKEERA